VTCSDEVSAEGKRGESHGGCNLVRLQRVWVGSGESMLLRETIGYPAGTFASSEALSERTSLQRGCAG